jgi:hypothetical protein
MTIRQQKQDRKTAQQGCDYMQKDLSFLDIGKPWPPKGEEKRLDKYHKNCLLFDAEHATVYEEDLRRIERVIGNFDQVISYPTILNIQKLISLKVADLLVGETPKITAGDAGSKEQLAIDTIIKNSGEFGLISTLHEISIDTSRYGDGLLYIERTADGGEIGESQPVTWFPVVAEDNIKRIVNHVIASIQEKDEIDKKITYLKVRIHNKGSYEDRTYQLEGGHIVALIESGKEYQTGLNDFAIVRVANVSTSDSIYGFDDYTDIDSIVAELIVRVGQIDRILDKHASPSMQGPIGALEEDPSTGEYKFVAGNYLQREADDPEIKYITWDGQLEAAFKQIEKLVNFLYTISEMGQAILGGEELKTGTATSGTALRLRMISPLAKVTRIRMHMDAAVKKAIRLVSKLGGKDIIDLSDVDISITWRDGLPSDPKEEAEIINQRTGGATTMSVKRVLTQYDGMSDDDAQTEVDLIAEETAMTGPLSIPEYAQTDNTGEEVTEGELDAPQGVKQSLNGAQMQSLLAVLTSYQTGALSRSAAINLITSSLPLTQEQAASIVEENK